MLTCVLCASLIRRAKHNHRRAIAAPDKATKNRPLQKSAITSGLLVATESRSGAALAGGAHPVNDDDREIGMGGNQHQHHMGSTLSGRQRVRHREQAGRLVQCVPPVDRKFDDWHINQSYKRQYQAAGLSAALARSKPRQCDIPQIKENRIISIEVRRASQTHQVPHRLLPHNGSG